MLACFTCLLSVRFLSWREINSNCLAIKCVSSLLQSAEGSSVLSWVHSVPALDVVTYYAFTFPYSYTLLQQELSALDKRLSIAPQQQKTQTDSSAESAEPSNSSHQASIYYVRELSINSLDGHRLDLLTVTSFLGITNIRENSLPGLFPDKSQQRPFKFANKKIIFISARVHPGETPASFVFNGFLDFITSDDPRAVKLRDLYVFKLMPMLNPDGVMRGHYRTDQLGVNLNRVYISPRIELHPTIFAARSLLIYYHNGTITSPETLSNDEFFRPSSLSSDNILSRKTSSNQPNILDEDTCHSFSDAGTSQEAKNFGKIAASHMEMDEPSASGWDISSNLSLDSNIHSNLSLDSNIRSNLSLDSNIHSNPVVFRAPEIPEMHDDCSNLSGVSEAETGVTSLFGALVANIQDNNIQDIQYTGQNIQDNTDTLSTTTSCSSSKCDCSTRGSSADFKCSKCNPKLKRATPLKSIDSGPVLRSFSKLTSSSLLKNTLLTEKNVRLHCDATGSAFKTFKLPPPELSPSSPSTFFSVQKSLQGASHVTHLSGGVPMSSSESEAEVGHPGKEGISVQNTTPRLSLPIPSLKGDNTSQKEEELHAADKIKSNLHTYVDLHGHASKRGTYMLSRVKGYRRSEVLLWIFVSLYQK